MVDLYECEVTRTGIQHEGPPVLIGLKPKGDTPWSGTRWFFAAEGQEYQMLSVALTAMSTGIRVYAQLTSTEEYAGRVERLYLWKE